MFPPLSTAVQRILLTQQPMKVLKYIVMPYTLYKVPASLGQPESNAPQSLGDSHKVYKQ